MIVNNDCHRRIAGLLGFGTLPRSASEKVAECHAAARVPALECLIVVSMWLSCVTVSDNDGPAMKAGSGCPLQKTHTKGKSRSIQR
jgi:hypothetical protein